MNRAINLRQLSVANLTVGRVDPVEFIEKAAAAGFGAVGLLVMSATSQPLQHEIVGRPEVMRAVKSALVTNGMRVFDIEAFILSPQTDLERMRPALAAGAELGATHISSIGTEFMGNTQLLEPAQRVDLFGRLCDEAAQFGLHVGVEFMLYRDIRTWEEALSLIEAAGRPNAGLILDLLHILRANTTPADLAKIPADRVAYAQLCDATDRSPALEELPTEARTDRLHLGDGVIPLDEILDLLPDGTPLVIETPVAAEAAWSIDERLKTAADNAKVLFDRQLMRA
ncbi:sugar phosphate isomerase/epimerase [Microvirga sp. VF16]|uniref:sugar phosphate isomerase/epimerase family protein n=1 Tax=Microvirga sp. VF16 TaxID=2807101 RepID=UPI00193D8D68|nr:sugar phosphate isomerase/epimerase [Microvirga sp. VF16]QRM33181.1 sugar phosphate isomerase/epimerase [Microvirga sp. VF16]